MDHLSKEKRSENMSKIKSKNTKPELIFRKELFKKGVRFRLHSRELPGRPDVVIKKYKIAIEIMGCFWHGHTECKKGHLPKTNKKFWSNKILKNKERDFKNQKMITQLGFKYFTVWECEVLNKIKLDNHINNILEYISLAKN